MDLKETKETKEKYINKFVLFVLIMNNPINITIEKDTHSKLSQLGKKTETFDDIINKLLQENGTKQ